MHYKRPIKRGCATTQEGHQGGEGEGENGPRLLLGRAQRSVRPRGDVNWARRGKLFRPRSITGLSAKVRSRGGPRPTISLSVSGNYGNCGDLITFLSSASGQLTAL